MMIRLSCDEPYSKREDPTVPQPLDVRAEFAIIEVREDGTRRDHTVASVERRTYRGTTKVEVNWSAWGARDLLTTQRFANTLTEALTFARRLEANEFTNTELQLAQGAIKEAFFHVMQGGLVL
jgi:hypothetical protein